MSSALVILAVAAPALTALWIAASRMTGLIAGRIATTAAGLSTLAAAILVGLSAADDTGEVGDVLGIGVDRVSSLLLVAVAGTGAVVAGFSRRNVDDEARTTTYFALLLAVIAASALVVLPGGPIALAIGWLVSGWALTALIGWQQNWSVGRQAQRRIFTTLAVGDVALVGALIVLALADANAVTRGDAEAQLNLADSTLLGIESVHIVALLLVLAGASRSALIPFHRWLIGTLAAPTPVSALVHAGLVSGAGLLLIRMSAPFVVSDIAVIVAFALGVVTVIVGAGASAMRSDTKGALAWSTVGQMAFMVIQCAVGAFSSAAFHIIGHGMYKASLFLGAGDTVSAGLRSSRRPATQPAPGWVRWIAVLAVPTAFVATGMWLITPEVSDAGMVLIAVFAWLSAAAGLDGWLRKNPLAPASAVASGVVIAAALVAAYLTGLRLVERFVAPSFADTATDTAIGPVATGIVIGLVAAGAIAVIAWPGLRGVAVRDTVQSRIAALATAGVASAATLPSIRSSVDAVARVDPDPMRSAQIRADVARAGRIIAPLWPLSSFVAVNPAGGLEAEGFDDAASKARRWLRGRTHLSLYEYRSDLNQGLMSVDDLRAAMHLRFMEPCARPPIRSGGHEITADEVILADLMTGPESDEADVPRTALERAKGCHATESDAINGVVARWLAEYMVPPTWARHRATESYTSMARRLATSDAVLAPLLGEDGRTWITTTSDDPAQLIAASFDSIGLSDDDRVAEMRGHLASLAGWAGIAKWRTEWAQPDDDRPTVSPIEIVAVRSMLEAALLGSRSDASLAAAVATSDGLLVERTASVIAHLGLDDTPTVHDQVAAVLSEIEPSERAATWLAASEARVDRQLLTLLDREPANGRVDRPDAQLVFCIDVRSEGLRRHLEAQGRDATIGFAGFFGIPMRIRQAGWQSAEARCPVLVAPAVDAIETPDPDAVSQLAGTLRRDASLGAALSAHGETKHVAGASFVAAETLGWLYGPVAAVRTFLSRARRTPNRPTTSIQFDNSVLVEQRVFFAESVLNTMGLTQGFAPIVALCGHTSVTTNNPHATALECGACAGASGDGNARAVASLLNSPDVRAGLTERGIDIPDDTWFIAGLHDTVSDHVELLDTAHAPDAHQPEIDALRRRLAIAATAQVGARAATLPGPDSATTARGADWAQVRPEWGLARNAAFVIGPRAMTEGLDLGGRAFLHTYDSENDPTGKVLETIMTAPLVVGHWISSQYYFSTVDPEVFGAGDKLLHNPVGTLGVLSGDGGDLRVGLPLQSTHIDGRRHHQPVRLLAVIEAEPARIEGIIDANPILQTLTSGSWIRIAARPHAGAPWSTRSPHGTWTTPPTEKPDDALASLFGEDHLVTNDTPQHDMMEIS